MIYIYILLLCLPFSILNAQNLDGDSAKVYGLQGKKTANDWDALPNYIQVVAQEITSNNSSIQFSGSLFSIDPFKDSIQKYANTFYLNHTWLRNTFAQVGVSLAKDNSISGFKAGFIIDILNLRDKSLVKYYDIPVLKISQKDFYNVIGNIQNKIVTDSLYKLYGNNPTPQQSLSLSTSILNAVNVYIRDSSKTDGLKNFIKTLNDSLRIKYKLPTYPRVWKRITAIYDSISNSINSRPLWTLTPTTQYALPNQKLAIKTYDVTSELIVGIYQKKTTQPWDLDAKLDGTIGDTATGIINLKREVWDANLGLNKVLLTAKDNKTSIMEFKFGGEVDGVAKDLKAGEKMYTYLGDVVLRVRAGSSFWIPLTIKYDITHHNFLGFLNVSVNIDKSGSSSSGGSSSSNSASSK